MKKSSGNFDIFTTKKSVLQKKNILLVEDSNDIRVLYKFILEQGGFNVFTAENGMNALLVLSQIPQPDLILLDMQLGDMTGIGLLNLVEEKRPEMIQKVPIVFLTGMDVVPISKAVGFIRKPADFDELIDAAHRFIQKGAHFTLK